jgi:hypothetical protein
MKSFGFGVQVLLAANGAVNAASVEYRQAAPAYSPPVTGPRYGTAPWLPKVGQRIQVILDRRVMQLDPEAALIPNSAEIWDLDLLDTPKETFDILHAHGKRIFCYMSAGGSESWRADFNQINPADLGDNMPKWKGEKYLNLNSPTVWQFMQRRIRMAYDKGCDAIDPDNLGMLNEPRVYLADNSRSFQ